MAQLSGYGGLACFYCIMSSETSAASSPSSDDGGIFVPQHLVSFAVATIDLANEVLYRRLNALVCAVSLGDISDSSVVFARLQGIRCAMVSGLVGSACCVNGLKGGVVGLFSWCAAAPCIE